MRQTGNLDQPVITKEFSMSVLDRFVLPDGRRNLRDALLKQPIFLGDIAAAEAAIDLVILEEFTKGATIIEQGASDNDLFFIIRGNTSILVNGRVVASRGSGQHVGEMALIDPSALRSATVIANEDIVVARISEQKFSSLANCHPAIWRFVGVQLADRLRERSRFIKEPNPQPHVFIGSSRESLAIANCLKNGLSGEPTSVYVWTDDIFTASATSIESLESELGRSDFAILLLAPDDRVFSRDKGADVPRDNVIFELGLFMGALTRSRTFFVMPHDRDIKIPSDLAGVTPLTYTSSGSANVMDEISNVCSKIRVLVKKLGPR